MKYREEKLRQKEALIEKYKAKKATLETQIVKTENQIRKKEEMGDDLKFIDFHQLQIENKKYVKEIDEKNDHLLSLKISTGMRLIESAWLIMEFVGRVTNKLTGEKKGLQKKVKDGSDIRAENSEKRKNIENARKEMKKIDDEIDQIQKKNRELDAAKKQIENMPEVNS